MRGYVGSIAVSGDGARVAATSPRGGRLIVWNASSLRVVETRHIPDVCGLAPGAAGFLASDGQGRLWFDGRAPVPNVNVAWDNHIGAVPVGAVSGAVPAGRTG